ncbi:hypothetical protein A2U01_0051508 [Trifolium medium]|uniref:Ubiquitin-like domain-containing protein n=1 Tax=Trifolium medium TaxID=97028 RepID=A0A392R232_9FABA|nr:hypothetical protein [Trifolium medium]
MDLMNFTIHWMDYGSDYTFDVEMKRDATIMDLKLKIEEITQCPPKTQTLWCYTSMGELEDQLTIGSSNRISTEMNLQTDTRQTTFKVRNATHGYSV